MLALDSSIEDSAFASLRSGKVLEGSPKREGDAEFPLGMGHDYRFDHSWASAGPSLGWYWIPKGRLSMDRYYPAGVHDVHRFCHQARKVRVLP